MNKNKRDIIQDIFYKIFKIKKLKNFNKLKMGQVSRWDSLSHLNFLLNIEEQYKVKFTINEMSSLNSIKKIKKSLEKKIKLTKK